MVTIGIVEFRGDTVEAWIRERCCVTIFQREFRINELIGDDITQFLTRNCGVPEDNDIYRVRVLKNCSSWFISYGIKSNLTHYIYKSRKWIGSNTDFRMVSGPAEDDMLRWMLSLTLPHKDD
jgi:hypothetical protein